MVTRFVEQACGTLIDCTIGTALFLCFFFSGTFIIVGVRTDDATRRSELSENTEQVP